MKKIWRQVTAGLVLGAAAQLAQAGVVWSVNGHEYDLVNSEGITWTDANAAAQALGNGWYLATITSAEENDFVVASVLPTSTGDRSHYWIGANDAANEGSFVWGTGEAFGYTNWWGLEPNNAGGVENYLAYDARSETDQAGSIRMSWRWNDAPDNLGQLFSGYANGYLIERAVGNSVPAPGGLALLGLGLGLLAASIRRRTRG